MRDDDLLIKPEKLEALREEVERKLTLRRRAKQILYPAENKTWWRKMISFWKW